MKKILVVLFCLVYITSIVFPVLFKIDGEQPDAGYSALFSHNRDVIDQAEKILLENGVKGIVSENTQRAFFPEYIQQHEYFQAVKSWFHSDYGHYLYYPSDFPVQDYLKNLEGLSFPRIKNIRYPAFFFAGTLILMCLFFTPYKIRFFVSVLPGVVAFSAFNNVGFFIFMAALGGGLTGIHRILYDEGFRNRKKKSFKVFFSICWIDLFIVLMFGICPFWNIANLIPLFTSVSGTCAAELFFYLLADSKKKKLSRERFFVRIKKMSGAELASKTFPLLFRGLLSVFLILGTVFFAFFLKPVFSLFPGQPIVVRSEYTMNSEGIRDFILEHNRKKFIYSDIPAYLNLCWEIKAYPYLPVTEKTGLDWIVPPDKVPEDVFLQRYKTNDSGVIIPSRELVFSFGDKFIKDSLSRLPPLEKMLASYGKIAYATGSALDNPVYNTMGNKGLGYGFNHPVLFILSILLVLLLFLPVNFLYNREKGVVSILSKNMPG